MKDLSFFLLKNSLGAKMRKGFRSSCNNDGSTSTLNQQTKADQYANSSIGTKSMGKTPYILSNEAVKESRQPTLEEMILQLELEEKMGRARRAKLANDDDNSHNYGKIQHRMSCVNSSDILRTARNALNQYPRFSLDGKDAMYRSSFRNLASGGRKSIYCNHDFVRKGCFCEDETKPEKIKRRFPAKVAGESVVWCKPGVVAKLMGLESMPVPVNGNYKSVKTSSKKKSVDRRAQRNEMERRRKVEMNGWRGMRNNASCSRSGYCVMKPVEMELEEELGWPMRQFL